MKTTRIILSTILVLSFSFAFGQRGKDGTLTQSGTAIVNEFTTLTSNASIGNTTISVANSSLNSNTRFSGNLAAGDLILIIQMQGVDMIGAPNSWDGAYGLPIDPTWGQISNYFNCGNNEYAEVKSVPNGTSIELRCGLSNSYTASGNVQIVRVPRYLNLTINGTLTSQAWNGSIGGVLAIEVDNNLIINGSIDASALGFRGGIANNTASSLGVAHWSRPDLAAGGLKAESVRGWGTEYDIHGGRYCKAAPTNSGGGGNANNGGGGGGGNAGDITNWIDGVGVPQGNYNAWNIETLKDEVTPAPIGGVARSGGGRGGYTFSGSNQNANSLPTGNAAWGGDNRRNRGGLGGRPLDYSTGRIYLGGAGGAADLNENTSTGGGGGNGGGIIYILNYGTVSGNGSITSNGQNGEDVTGPTPSGFNQIAGADGAGGAGAGGTILLNSNGLISGISITTDGGKGGDQILVNNTSFISGNMNEAEGPGGGGGGGYISISSGTPTRTANGGMNGVTNSQGVTEFPMNGATAGGVGLPNETISNFYLTTTNDTICIGTTSTLTAAVNGTLPGGSTITWYDAEVNGNVIGTNTFTTATLSNDTIFYVGTCPGTYLIPVSVIISPPLTFNDASVVIGDENCGLSDGSISGITVSGGTAPIIYTWNGVASATTSLSGVSANSYTLVATDAKGCSITVGTYTISNVSSLSLNATNIVLTNENCGLGNGGISGITTTGGTGTITYDWNGAASTNEDLSNIGAGSYTLTATDGVGCSTTSGPYVITNTAGPTINASSISITDESCTAINGSITGLIVSGGSSPYSYSWNGNSTLGVDTTNLAAGNFTLIVTDASGCTDQVGPYAVIDNAAPTLNETALATTDETCGSTNGSIAGITVSGGSAPYIYSWNGNTTLTADTAFIGSGTYTLTVTDANGCTAISSSIVITNLGLTVDTTSLVLVNDACTQGSGSLSGITVSGGSPGYNYSWNGSTSLTADTSNLLAGTYTLVITDQAGCIFTTNPYTIIDNTGPTIDTTAIVVTDETCSSANGSITGITSSGGLLPFTFTWNGNNSTTEDTTGISGGNYTLIITDGNGCSSTMGPIVVSAISGPTIDTTAIVVVDENCYAGNGSISGIVANGGTAPCSYSWNGIASSIDISTISNGNYILSVTDANGCTATLDAITINNSGAPIANFSLSGDSISLGETLTLTNNSSSDAVTYSWTLGNGTNSTDVSPSVLYSNANSFNICLVAYTATNCTDTICKTVSVIEEIASAIGIPSGFSPNGDGTNDILFVRGSGISTLTFMVYNRYGEKVFETTDITEGWNGTFKGKPENIGVFAYYIEYEYTNGDKGSLKGNVTLVK